MDFVRFKETLLISERLGLAMQNVPEKQISFYCLCSDSSFDDILEKQREASLTFQELLEKHTHCLEGCGSCIGKLQSYLISAGSFIA